MKIIVDTREQLPLEFQHHYITEVINTKLEVGDYGCQLENGYRIPICFERKSISDLFGTLSAGYKRFKKEILRAKEAKVVLVIIIEGTLLKSSKGLTLANGQVMRLLNSFSLCLFGTRYHFFVVKTVRRCKDIY
jgi:ERCC4-type nuclease